LSFRHRFPPLRALLLVFLLVGSGVAPMAAAAAADTAAETPSPQASIGQAERALQAVRRSLDDAEAPETLRTLSEQAQQARRDADAAVAALMPQLEQVDARIAQLGPLDDGATEERGIARQRSVLDQQRSQLDGDIKRGKLLAEDARQLSDSIEKTRSQQFGEQLGRKVGSPLSPALWRRFADSLPDDLSRIQGLYRQAAAGLKTAVAAHGWTLPLLGAAVALLMAFPLRWWLRRLGRRYAASDRAPAGRLRRSGLAVWLLLVGTLLPGLAALAATGGLQAIDAVPPRMQTVADAFVQATFVSAFIVALAACLLVPHRPSWRMLNIDDAAALRLRQLAWGAAGLTWLTMLLRALNRAARTSQVSTVLLDGMVALVYVGLISAMLVTIARLHRRRSAEAALAEQQAGSEAKVPPSARTGWLVLARLGGYLAVLAALVATLAGYLNFAMFAAQQMAWITLVVLAVQLLTRFADDLALWLFTPDNALGCTLRRSLGVAPARLEQAGVLLSAALRVGLVMLGIAAALARFGNTSLLYGWAGTLESGLHIGGQVLRPASLLWAVVVLLLGLGLMKALQQWLTDTYLPKTDLDAGLRNSISTVARYLGIVLAVLWALATLGIGFEKLALLASALSVGIGFGLQAITQNFVSGLILLAERPVKIGDWVKLGDQEGDIRRISVRSTEIQVGDKSTLIVPNSELITKTIRNMTMANAQGRIQIQFSVPLGTDVGRVRQMLLDLFAANEKVLAEPAPSVFIDSIGGGLVALNCFAYVSSPRAVYGARSELLFELLRTTSEQGIALATPTDVRLVRDSPQAPGPTQ
jgi:potassium efflux system protein